MRVPTSSTVRKIALSLTAVAVVSAALVALNDDTGYAAQQEVAAASCTLNVPATISIDSPALTPAVTVGSDCAAAGVVLSKWDAKLANGTLDHQFMSRWNKPDVQWNVFDDAALGVRTWHPAGATTGADPAIAPTGRMEATVPQNTPVTDIRRRAIGQLVSWSFVAGCKATFSAAATRYAARWDGYVSLPDTPGKLQFRLPGQTAMKDVATFVTDAAGKASVTVPTTGADGEWRVWIDDVPASTWAASSSWRPIDDPC